MTTNKEKEMLKNNIGKNNIGENNSGDRNSGDWNSGYWNSGDWNSGYGNSGDRNSGYGNSGDRNSGNWNSGNRNSGNWNSGYWNSGDRNSGYGNSGNWNSGYWNSGDRNSGNGNSGDWNSGYGNSTNRSSGIFCSEEGTVRLFNRETNLKWDDIDHPYFEEFYLNKWIPESEMTDEEKKAEPNFFVMEGYLKTYTWEEAWSNYWRDSDEEERQKVLNLPNFDAKIFKDITGIDVESTSETIEIGGKVYKVTDELKQSLKNLKEV